MKGNVVGQGGLKIENLTPVNKVIASGESLSKGNLITFSGELLTSLPKRTTLYPNYNILPAVANRQFTSNYAVEKLNATQFITVYATFDTSVYYLKARVITINPDLSLTEGVEYAIGTVQAQYIRFLKLDVDKFVLAYSIGTQLRTQILTVSSGVISVGVAADYGTGIIAGFGLTIIDTTRFAFLGMLSATNYYRTVVVCTVSGTTITFGATNNVDNVTGMNNGAIPTMITIAPNKIAALAKSYNGTQWVDTIYVGTVSGTTVTFGTGILLRQAAASVTYQLLKLEDNVFLLTSTTNGGSVTKIYSVSGNTMTDIYGGGSGILPDNKGVQMLFLIEPYRFALIVRDGNPYYPKIFFYKLSSNYATLTLEGSFATDNENGYEAIGYLHDSEKIIVQHISQVGSTYMRASVSKIIKDTTLARGLALQNGTAGQTIKAYDWR